MSTAIRNLGFFRFLARVLRTGLACALPVIAGVAACGGTSDVPACNTPVSTTPQAAGSFCAPSTIAAGQPLRLQIREQCGGCTQHATRCQVVVKGQDVQLLGEFVCLPPNSACPAICSVNTFDCAVPALAAGTYRVATPAGSSTVSMMTADATVSATSCTLPTP